MSGCTCLRCLSSVSQHRMNMQFDHRYLAVMLLDVQDMSSRLYPFV